MLDINCWWDKPWTEFTASREGRLDNIDLGEDDPGFYMELPEDDGQDVEIGATIYLDTYKGWDHIEDEYLTEPGEDGWLTDEAGKKVLAFYRDILARPGYDILDDPNNLWYSEDIGGSDPHFTIQYVIPANLSGTTGEVFEKYVNEFFRAIFNSYQAVSMSTPYLFASLDEY